MRLGLPERLETGSVTINDHMITFSEPKAIWGGIKQTGMGRSHGSDGLLESANIKFINADFSEKEPDVVVPLRAARNSRSWRKRSP